MGSIPAQGRSCPERESSPRKAQLSSRSLSCPPAASSPTRIGRSYRVPIFFTWAGARLTVIRLTGKVKPQFLTAERTRSRASFTAASGRPTMVKAGRPPDRSHSTDTG